MMVTTGVRTMIVEVTVAAVLGMAISRQDSEERGRRVAHDYQLNDENSVYDDEAVYDANKHIMMTPRTMTMSHAVS